MAADSHTFRGEQARSMPPNDPKIARAPDGSLVGASGDSSDTYMLREWVRMGMDFGTPPHLEFTDPDKPQSIDWIWMKLDGSLWRGDCKIKVFPVVKPYAIGIRDAVGFVEGMLAAGATLKDAMEKTIGWHTYVGGPVQIERVGCGASVNLGKRRIPQTGHRVIYMLDADDAEKVNRTWIFGNVRRGDQFPMIIIRVFSDTPDGAVSGMVDIGGHYTLWVTLRTAGNEAGQWRWPE
jgi:hypothetical protein